jgi:hypothetical protein
MYGRVYNVICGAVAMTVEQDLFEIVAPSTGNVVIRALEISQGTEVGDAQDEMLRMRIMTGATTSGSGGSSATPIPKALGNSAFGGTAEINNTTLAQDGTIVTHRDIYFPVRAGYVWNPAEDSRLVIRPSTRLVVRLAAPGDSVTFSATLEIEELG